ncbi:hypothetical protein SANT12839_010580 [Streptomyces antimycoticus]|uniref:Uncharacterized protein n=1 Tax=Streptomyces antimycoticus TaxID=68175 RepID=A0A4D4K0G9_9ACTN|nr:hypothetical protein SANT12839_010580 [Streptomyces antimycoticus]
MGGVGDDDLTAAGGEQMLQFGLGNVRIDRDADATGTDDGEVALHHLDAIAEVHGHAVTRQQTQPGQMAGEPTGAHLQFAVTDGATGVDVGGFVAEAAALLGEEVLDRADQFGAQHAPFPSLRSGLQVMRQRLHPLQLHTGKLEESPDSPPSSPLTW